MFNFHPRSPADIFWLTITCIDSRLDCKCVAWQNYWRTFFFNIFMRKERKFFERWMFVNKIFGKYYINGITKFLFLSLCCKWWIILSNVYIILDIMSYVSFMRITIFHFYTIFIIPQIIVRNGINGQVNHGFVLLSVAHQ